ncbi:MAG: hypothetical protein M3Z43_01195 [Bifidobacterium sp.]|uniref:hypothetical protein n=1 Tax=Bifidobacterium apicola TaxID=3230739 RepID=UPI0036F3F464|nr:hypothetical protein [Bifidobacterium sp.]
MTALGVLAVGLADAIVFLAAIGVCYRFVDAPGNGSRTAAWIMIGMMMICVIFVQGLVAPVTWLLFALINVCALVFAWIMVPETRGKSLAQIEQEARARA